MGNLSCCGGDDSTIRLDNENRGRYDLYSPPPDK